MNNTTAEPIFFATPAELRAWLHEHHATAREQWVGFYKKGSGRPSITWPESVDEADEQQMRANPAAWQFFQAQPRSYRQAAVRWVISAKKPETRQSRLARLIEDSAQERTVPSLTRPAKVS